MIKLLLKYNTFSGAGPAIPLYGTELYKISTKRGYLHDDVLKGDISLAYTKAGRLNTEDFDSGYPIRIINITERMLYYLEIIVFFKRILHAPSLLGYIVTELKKGFNRKNIKRIFNVIVFWIQD